jgi:NADP-dependent 3-hydroxy acid dehydrogenase YdfG
MFDLKGRVAAITGASSGLGLQMAKGFAGQGADLVIMARRIDRLEQVAEELRALGVKCLPVQCDVTDTDSVNKAAHLSGIRSIRLPAPYGRHEGQHGDHQHQ